MANKNYLMSGITELLILSILNDHDSYVYEIGKIIQTESKELLSISQNTIYTATYKLEKEHKISTYKIGAAITKTSKFRIGPGTKWWVNTLRQ